MAISDETLKAIIRDYNGFDLTSEELALVRPEIEFYMEEVAKLEELDLSNAFSSRLLRLDEQGPIQQGGPSNG